MTKILIVFDGGSYIEIEDKYIGIYSILDNLKDKEDYIKIQNYIIPKVNIKYIEEVKEKEEDVNVTTCE